MTLSLPQGSNPASNTAILDATVARAVRLGFIPSSESSAVRQRIIRLSNKYSINPNDFAILSMTETEGLDPRAGTNCVGIIQFCRGTGAATVGYPGDSYTQITNLSVLQQLDLVDRYFEALNLEPGSGLEDLYLTILMPAARSIRDRNTPLPIPPQADNLYTTGDRTTGVITRDSLKRGLESKASSKLGIPVNGTIGTPIATQPGSASETLFESALNSLSTFITNGVNCAPPEYDIISRLMYTGCSSKVSQTKQGGSSGLGYPSPGVTALGVSSNTSTDINQPYTGPLIPGGFIKPANLPVTSGFGPRYHPITRVRKDHQGLDLGGPEGTPVYASADGIVDPTTGNNSDGYGNVVALQHAQNFFTLYAHLSRILVSEGERVRQGQIIGTVGSTGLSTGNHLHFEIRVGGIRGRALDPQDFIGNS